MFLQRPVSNFFWERNFVQYACMGLPDLMMLEQIIYIYIYITALNLFLVEHWKLHSIMNIQEEAFQFDIRQGLLLSASSHHFNRSYFKQIS